MSYDLTIQFDDEATASTDAPSVESFLQSYPGARRLAANQWIHEPNSSVHVEIDLVPTDDTDPKTINSIGVGVPYPFLPASGEPALQLCFTLAERLGWRVFDEQIGEFVHPGDIPKLVARQAEFAHDAHEILADNEAPSVATWVDHWTSAATQQSLLFMVVAIVLAGAGAIAVVLQLDVQEDKMATYLFWIGSPIALAVFTIKITFDAWLKNRRKARNRTADNQAMHARRPSRLG
jgi:hypothetical protein